MRWKHVQLVGEDLDLRKVSWRLPVDVISYRLSTTDTEASGDEAPTRTGDAKTPLLQGEDYRHQRQHAQCQPTRCVAPAEPVASLSGARASLLAGVLPAS